VLVKIIIHIFLIFVPLLLFSQLQDDFSDGNFYVNPNWQGDVDSFDVQNYRLHLNAPANSSESYLFTTSNGAVSGKWEFYVEMAFNPSSSNKIQVYLMSDSSNLKGDLHGYFVMIGNTADEISLYKQSNSSTTKIIDGMDDYTDVDTVKVKVKVTRDALGTFELFADTSIAQNNYVSQGTVFDDTYLASNYFGVLCDYTSTRSDKFWLDDFNVNTQTFVDIVPPRLSSFSIASLNEISLIFNEPLDSLFTLESLNYTLNNTYNPFNINYLNQEVNLSFTSSFVNNISYDLQIHAKDFAGNSLDTTINFIINNNTPFQAALINEIYADENPSFGMPAYEFLELKNNTNDTLFMFDWQLADATDTTQIPSDYILANEYIILCKSSAFNDYAALGKTIAVPNFPSLNNSGDELLLLNKYGNIIDSVTYSNTWYREETDSLGNFKKDGGYSLERITLANSCSNFYNWFPSIDTLGATPGAENSVINYVFPPTQIEILDILIDNDTTLIVYFSDEIPFINSQNCSVSDNVVEQVYNLAGTNQLYVLLQNKIETSIDYIISFENLTDCYGNSIPNFSKEFYRLETPTKDDLVINEILFNPKTGGTDYIEIYNKSNKAINLEGFQILEYDVFEPSEITDDELIENITIGPKAYVVLSEDTQNIQQNYIVENINWLYENRIPNFNDDQSIVVLKFPNGETIDSLVYNKSWHFELLDDQNGVSLERIDAFGESNDRNNWHSAAKTYGYGTPTAVNSQVFESNLEENVIVEPEVFTPNEDGLDDFCLIHYNNGNIGEVATIKIFDALGRETKLIAQNHSLGQTNTWKWNGTNNNFEKADVGIYIVLFEVFDLNGKTHRIKKKVVLGARLN